MATSDNRYSADHTDSDFESEAGLTGGPSLSHASPDPSSPVIEERPYQLALRRLVLKKYGMTPEDYVVMWHAQGGLCAICRRPETAMRAGTPKMLAVDHDNVTGRVRGLLCFACNAGLGLFKDNCDSLRAAITYLDKAASANDVAPVPAGERAPHLRLEAVPFRQLPILGEVA